MHSDEMMDFLKAIVKDVPDLSVVESPVPGSPVKRTRAVSAETGRVNRRGRGEPLPGRGPKRQRVPHTSPDGSGPVTPSVFASLTQRGPDGGTLIPSTTWRLSSLPSPSLQLSHSETQPMVMVERPGRFSSLPTMTSAVRTRETHVDPTTLPLNLQKALHVPVDAKTTVATAINMPPVSMALSISDVELGMRSKEMDTPLSIHDLSSTKQFLKNLGMQQSVSVPQNAEEDNYEFSDDDMDMDSNDPKKEMEDL